MPWKSDRDAIRKVIDHLAAQQWLDPRKRVWPNYIYYFGDIRNIAQALRCGRLYSRQQCVDEGIAFIDGADQEVIAQSLWTHQFVRLYFRPHTPTLLHQEGIRPLDDRIHQAHCGVPVFLLFHSRTLLARAGVGFVGGNFGASRNSLASAICYTAPELAELPFDEIYHDEPFSAPDRDNIIYRRHAEVVCPYSMELTDLAEIVCRTTPERETLLRLLGESASEWDRKIRLERPGERLFFRQWLRVEDVKYSGTRIHVGIEPPEKQDVTFSRIRVQVWTDQGRLLKDADKSNWQPKRQIAIQLPADSTDVVRLRCEIEDALAYEGVINRTRVY